jgi:hypothetical protein
MNVDIFCCSASGKRLILMAVENAETEEIPLRFTTQIWGEIWGIDRYPFFSAEQSVTSNAGMR